MKKKMDILYYLNPFRNPKKILSMIETFPIPKLE